MYRNVWSRAVRLVCAVLPLLSLLLSSPSAQAALILNPTNSGSTLAGILAGSGITTSNINFTGSSGQAATFTGGTSAGLGFNSGILLSTGLATSASNAASSDADSNLSGPGDASLNTLAGVATFDAASLTFNFQFGDGSNGGNLYFNFIFASEEYPEFVGSGYSDAFGIFLNGTNIANIPGTGTAVSINSINNSTNPGLFRNNSTGSYLNTFDGFTNLLQASVSGLGPGTHTIKFAIADAYDQYMDSAVFLQTASFGASPVAGDSAAVPEPGQIAASVLVLAGIVLLRVFRSSNSTIPILSLLGNSPGRGTNLE